MQLKTPQFVESNGRATQGLALLLPLDAAACNAIRYIYPIPETLMHKDLIDLLVIAVDGPITCYDLVDRFVFVPLVQPKRLVVCRTVRRSASRCGTATA